VEAFTVVQAKSHFSALLAQVEAGAEVAVTRHGKVVARLVPDHPRVAADAFRDLWSDKDTVDLRAPEDALAEDVATLDE